MTVGKGALVICGAFGSILPLLCCCAATTAGALASPTDKLLQQQQQQQQQQQPQQEQQHKQVLSMLRKSRGGGSRLRGGAGSSSTVIDFSHPESSAATAAAAAAGGGAAAGGETVDARKTQAASVVGAKEDVPGEKSAAWAARGQTKQGSRRKDDEDDDGDSDNGVLKGENTGASVAIIFGIIAAVVLVFLGWCWLSSLVVCVSWCVCKCVKPNSRDASSSSASGGRHPKHVDDSYANAVRATFCGTLARVVCVSDGDGPGVADDEAVAASQPCTPQQPGSNSSASGSISTGGNDSNNCNIAASAMNGEATAIDPAINGGAKAAAGGGDGAGAGSNSSSFSAIFRCSLTATAVAPGTPGVTPTAQDNSFGWYSHYPQQQQGAGLGISSAFCSPADGGSGDGGGRSLFWEAEEKRSEVDSNAVVVAPPQGSSRLGVRFFGRGNGRGNAGSERGRIDSQSTALPATTWSARVWARLRSVGGGTDDGNLNDLQGIEGTETSGVSDSDGFSGQSSEGAIRHAEQRSAAGGSMQVVETVTHRRRLAPRVAGSRAAERGHNSNGHLGATPAVSVNGNNNGRGTDGVTAVLGCRGTGAGGSATGAVVGSHERSLLAEVGAAGAAVEDVAYRNTPNGRYGGGEAKEAAGEGGEGAEAAGNKAIDFLPAGDVITESSTAGTSVSTAGEIAAAACVDPLMNSKRQHHPEGKGLEDAGKEKGGCEKETGGGDCRSPPGDTASTSPVLPRARVLWRAFSEVDHGTIGENHRRARLRYLARLGPAPGIENPPMCYSPFQG